MIVAILITILISFFTLRQSFELALFGDDWLTIWRYLEHLGPESPGRWNYLTYFLNPYGAQDIVTGILFRIFGFHSTPFYTISYFLRLFAAFSLFPLIFYLTKNKLAAYFSVIFFAVTPIGLDTTNWVFNMTSYIDIIFFNIFLYLFLRTRSEKSVILYVLTFFLYYITFVTQSIRMHGLTPFIFLIELFWLLRNRNIKTLKRVALRISTVALIFLFIRFSGQSMGPPEEAIQRLTLGVTRSREFLQTGRIDFILNPIISFGSMIIPENLLSSGRQIIAIRQFIFQIFIPSMILLSITLFLFRKAVPALTFKNLFGIFITAFIWSIAIELVNKINPITFSSTSNIFLATMGGYMLIIIISLLVKFLKDERMANTLFLSITWIFLSFFFAWWWAPDTLYLTNHRYLIVSAVGIAIIFAVLISLARDKKQLLLLPLFSLILILHIFSTHQYTNQALEVHGQKISNKIWSSVPNYPQINRTNRDPLLFYFEGDGSNAAIMHDVITFGFPPHMALIYNLREANPLPHAEDDFKKLVSATEDVESAKPYGYLGKSIPLENIYGFSLIGRDNLIDTTDKLRKKIIETQILKSK